MRSAWLACVFLCACTATPQAQAIEQTDDPPLRASSGGWAGFEVQPDRAAEPAPPPVLATPEVGPRIELVEESGCTVPVLAGLPAITEDGQTVAFEQWDSDTELLELVLRPLSGAADTRVTLSTAEDGMCFAEPDELATLERRVGQARRALARKRWRTMAALPYHLELATDFGPSTASCSKIDLAATEAALRREWPANLDSPTWLLTCGRQPRIVELLFGRSELIVREPGIEIFARVPMPEVVAESRAPDECAPHPQLQQAWFDEPHHVAVMMVTQRDSYMCEYPYRMVAVKLELPEPHAPLAFPPDFDTAQSEAVLRHLPTPTD